MKYRPSIKLIYLLLIFLLCCMVLLLNYFGFFENRKVKRLTEDFILWYTQHFPIEATSMGYHDFDSELDNYEADNIKEIVGKLKFYSSKFAVVDSAKLSFNQKVNFVLVSNQIKRKLFELDKWQRHRTDAFFYTEKLYNAVHSLENLLNDSTLNATRDIFERLKKIPDFLQQAQENLTITNDYNIEYAIDQIENLEKQIAFKVPHELNLQNELKDSLNLFADSVVDSLSVFRGFLQSKLNQPDNNAKVITSENFQQYLKTMVGKSTDIGLLVDLIESDYQKIITQLYAIAKENMSGKFNNIERISRTRLIKLFDDEIQKDMPRRDTILPISEVTETHLKRFILDVANLKLPVDYTVSFRWKESNSNNSYDLLNMENTSLLDNLPYVCRLSPVANGLDLIEQLTLLREYNKATLKVLLLREAVPLHFHYWKSNLNNLPVAAKAFPDLFFLYGWKYYFAHSLIEMGYGGFDTRLKFTILKQIAHLYFNTYIELRYYFEDLSFSQIETIFDGNKLFHKLQVEEVLYRIHCMPFRDFMTYWGLRKIMHLENEFGKTTKSGFIYRGFYKNILGAGPIPLELVKNNLNSKNKNK